MNKNITKILIFFVVCLLGFGKLIFDNNIKNSKNQQEIKKIVSENITQKSNKKSNSKTKKKKVNTGNSNTSKDGDSSKKYEIDYDHIIGGDENSSGKVTGGHTTLRGDVKVIRKIGQAASNGVYRASIEIRKKNGTWQKKTSNGGINTMFPEDWNEKKVIEEINSAWENRKDYNGKESNMWQGRSKSGVLIRGYKSPRITAYPIYEGGK